MAVAAPLVLGAAGAFAGASIAGAIGVSVTLGASIGWSLGAALGASFAPGQKQYAFGPRLTELKVTGAEYGQTIPYVEGHPRLAGQIWWASSRREIATTTATETGGKGGGGGTTVYTTTYTYEVDLLIGLTDNEIAGVARIWSNGELVWTAHSSSDASSRAASNATELWSRMTVYTGASDQTPDPTYEAAVGTANAPAYRGRGAVFIQSLQLGQTGQIPNLTFELCTRFAAEADPYENYVILMLHGDDAGSPQDVYDDSDYHIPAQITGGVQSGAVSGAFGERAIQFFAGATGENLRYDQPLADMTTYPSGDLSGFAPFTIECRFRPQVQSGGTTRLLVQSSGGTDTFSSDGGTNFDMFYDGRVGVRILYARMHASSAPSQTWVIASAVNTVVIGEWQWAAMTWDGTTMRLYHGLQSDGVAVLVASSSDYVPTPLSRQGTATPARIYVGSYMYFTTFTPEADIEEVRCTRFFARYTGASYTLPAVAFYEPNPAIIIPGDETLRDVVERLCARAGLAAAQYDASDLANAQKDVHAMAINQVSSTRSVEEMLASAYFFSCVNSDKLYFRMRGGASARTFDYDDLGAAADSSDDDRLPLRQGNDIEIPARIALTYSNVDSDYNTDTQESDRLVSAVDDTTATVQLPLGFSAGEAKGIADAMALDQACASLKTGISVLGEDCALEPTDVVTVTAADGTLLRFRVVQKEEAFPLIKLDLAFDDAGVLESEELTSSDYEGGFTVSAPVDTVMKLLDIAILRDVDDNDDLYTAAKGDGTPWPGATLFKSVDDVTYGAVQTYTDSTVIGDTTTALNDWNGPRVFDEFSFVTVDVGTGTLNSSTRDAILNDQSVNAALIGDEIVQFRDATLVSTGVYTLTGFLRGSRGTEWAMTGHASGEDFILLQMSGMRRVAMDNSELGVQRYYRGVTFGRTLESAAVGSPPEGTRFTHNAVGLKPFSPVDIRLVRDEASGDITLTWERRSRLSCRLTGALGISIPLGEDSESYSIDIYSNAGSPQTVVRTLTATTTSASYTAAQQTTDFGSPLPSSIIGAVYQLSATVGRGYAATFTG